MRDTMHFMISLLALSLFTWSAAAWYDPALIGAKIAQFEKAYIAGMNTP